MECKANKGDKGAGVSELANAGPSVRTDTKPLVETLMREYFELKAQDKAIRQVRNAYMEDHRCLNLERLSTDFKDQEDYEDNAGECIYMQVGMGGYPAPLCEVCQKRNDWYIERQSLSRRRAQLIRRVKRLVGSTDSQANTTTKSELAQVSTSKLKKG